MKSSALLLTLGVALLLTACGDGARDGQGDADRPALQRDRVIRMIDQRRYQDAIELLESPEAQNTPEAPLLRPYLAHAYLGVAGLEPLDLAGRVMSAQKPRNETLGLLFRRCKSEAIRNF